MAASAWELVVEVALDFAEEAEQPHASVATATNAIATDFTLATLTLSLPSRPSAADWTCARSHCYGAGVLLPAGDSE